MPEFVALARRHGVAIVLALSDDYPMIADPTADFCYLRLQTTSADAPQGYAAPILAEWRERCTGVGAGRDGAGAAVCSARRRRRRRAIASST